MKVLHYYYTSLSLFPHNHFMSTGNMQQHHIIINNTICIKPALYTSYYNGLLW